ncbi:hypothetical protein EST38_g12877 [Candolleomyces aberdarensis]|uniref:Uncharacterized protein n=1 Tax=Candolleomyces aberdarensis TaxID=2316362 RepID=A0A4Q2D4A9_9AGAR|nr:hypothetical protein EST38_g12877 [Candolleomyces aberdarensis]
MDALEGHSIFKACSAELDTLRARQNTQGKRLRQLEEALQLCKTFSAGNAKRLEAMRDLTKIYQTTKEELEGQTKAVQEQNEKKRMVLDELYRELERETFGPPKPSVPSGDSLGSYSTSENSHLDIDVSDEGSTVEVSDDESV